MQNIVATLETGKVETIVYGTPASVVLSLESDATDLRGTASDVADGGVSEGEGVSDGEGAPVSTSPRQARTVAARVNNEIVGLSFKVEVNAKVLPVRLGTLDGERVFRQSLCFLLTVVAKQLFPERRIVIGHSLGDGYYYYFDGIDGVSEAETEAMSDRAHGLVEDDLPIDRRVLSYADALKYLGDVSAVSALSLLRHRNESKIPIFECAGFRDISHGPLVTSTGVLTPFEIRTHGPGFLLRFPPTDRHDMIKPFVDQPIVFSVFQEYKDWGAVLGISSAGQLNEQIESGTISEFIRVAEALHNKKIARVADGIHQSARRPRVVLIAGPSSSGKTTFTKKLSIQLRVLGYQPAVISTDDYFLSRAETPRDASGEYDFESIDAIDRQLLNSNLIELLETGMCELPGYDFKSGRRREKAIQLKLGPRGIVLIEGIHGLNPLLTDEIADDETFRIYISALTQLNIDDHNRIPTTDVRLIRRMVRDNQFRGYSAKETIGRWESVRRGENQNIFPYERNADVAFNSSLDYELPVLKSFAEPLLQRIKPHDQLYSEAVRLSRFLRNFVPISTDRVPDDSILREFIGGSSFRY